jgi:hypothetical protein
VGLGARAEQVAGLSVAGAGVECYYGVYVQRDCAGDSGAHSFYGDGRKTNPTAWLADHVFVHMPTPGWAAFAFSCFTLAYCFVPVWILYRKKIFVKV